jgi:chromosome partitioning protein
MIIAIANQKGGVGKTALTTHLAHGLNLHTEAEVLVVDADPQTGLHQHFSRRAAGEGKPYDIVAMPTADLHRAVPSLLARSKYGFCLIDCPAGVSHISRSACLAADVVLIPVSPSMADFDSARGMIEILQAISIANPAQKVLVVINRKKPGNNSYSKAAKEAAGKFFSGDHGIDMRVLETSIGDRMDMVKAYSSGKTIYEEARGSSSRAEFDQLTEEVLRLCNAQMA